MAKAGYKWKSTVAPVVMEYNKHQTSSFPSKNHHKYCSSVVLLPNETSHI